MSNISANSGGNLSLVQFLLNQSRRFACLAPKALNSGILCETLETPEQPPADVASPETVWFRNACTFSASSRRSWSLCTAFTSFRPGLSPRRTAPEKRPSSVSDSWWAFKADVNCIKADTKSGCFSFRIRQLIDCCFTFFDIFFFLSLWFVHTLLRLIYLDNVVITGMLWW